MPGATANCGSAAGDLTDVGSYTGSASPSGAFDQGGNVWEWNESPFNTVRAARGGGYDDGPGLHAASHRGFAGPAVESSDIGFRVGSLIVHCIGFEALEHDDTANKFYLNPAQYNAYYEDGFRVAPSSLKNLSTYGLQHQFSSGSTAVNGSHNAGSSFGLSTDEISSSSEFGAMLASVLFVPVTVHLSEFNSFSTGGTSVTFTGTFPVGPPVVQSFVLDNDVTTTETFSLAGFTGVKYLQWDSVHQIDNICIVSACADGLDNDGDRLIDLADPDCHDSSDQDERLTAIAVPSARHAREGPGGGRPGPLGLPLGPRWALRNTRTRTSSQNEEVRGSPPRTDPQLRLRVGNTRAVFGSSDRTIMSNHPETGPARPAGGAIAHSAPR